MLSCKASSLSRLQRSNSWLALVVEISDHVFSVEMLRLQYCCSFSLNERLRALYPSASDRGAALALWIA